MAEKRRRRKSRKAQVRQKLIMLSIGIVAVILLGVGISYVLLRNYVNKIDTDTIYQNVYIDTIDVSGMSKDKAKAAIDAKVLEYQSQTVTLDVEGETADVSLGELGLSIQDEEKLVDKAVAYAKDGSVWSRYRQIKKLKKEKKQFSMTYVIDPEKVQVVMEEKVRPLEKNATDATIERVNGKFVITDEMQGKEVDLEASLKAIEEHFKGNWQKKDTTITLVSKIDEPKVTRADLEQIQDVLGQFTTNCGVGGGRVQNIESGTKHINGALIMPGEEYSANAAMEPYTEENGYTNAGSYENGKVVQSMGGGICQVSSTLYNAILFAELEVTERMPHSMTVGYVDASKDAAIAGTWKDLKFKNNTETPIYIEGYTSGGNLTFKIYGKETRSASRTVEYSSEVLSKTEPKKNFVESGNQLGTIKKTDAGHTGVKARLWKIVKENGKEVSREIVNNSSYMASDATWTVGTNTDNAEAKKIVQDAIKSQDEAKINAAITQAKQVIANANKPQEKPEEKPEESTPQEPAAGNEGTTAD